jgi:hypothetical protein
MLIIFSGVLVSMSLFVVLFYSFFSSFGRFTVLKNLSQDFLSSVVNSLVAKIVFYSMFLLFILVNLSGNIPLQSIPTQYYSFTLTVSLLF